MNCVFAECLIGCIDVDFYVDEFESGIHRFVQKREEAPDAFGPSYRGSTPRSCKIGQLECTVLSKERSRFLCRAVDISVKKFFCCFHNLCPFAC